MFNKKNYIVIIVLFLISGGGARCVEEVPGAEHVNLVASVDQTQCELKGEVKDSVKGYSDSSLNNTETNLIQLGKNAAVEMNGNTIIILERKQYRKTQSAVFKIYDCK
jgi:hypothetical protein